MIASLIDGKHDVLLSGNSLTYSRSKLVDFSFPFTSSTVRMIYLRNTESTNWKFYIASFLPFTWISVGTSLCTLFVLFMSLLLLANGVKV